MNDKQRRRHERLVRVNDFGTLRVADFAAESKGGMALERLGQLLPQIESKDSSSFTNQRVVQQASARRKGARASLRTQLATISDAAETIGKDHEEVRDKFRRPRHNSNDRTLLGVARSVAAEAATFKALFLEYEMPADFIDRLNESIDELAQAIEQQNIGEAAQRAASGSVEQLLTEAEDQMERFDTAVRIKYLNDMASIKVWESARHLERPPRSSKKNVPTAPKP